MLIDPDQPITFAQAAFFVAGSIVVARLIWFAFDIFHNQLAKRFHSIPTHNGHGLDGDLRASLQRMESEQRVGIAKIDTKLDAMSVELHRRITDVKKEVHIARVEIAERYVLKEDHKTDIARIERRIDKT